MVRYKMKPRLKVFILLAVVVAVASTLITQEMGLSKLNQDKTEIISKINELKDDNEYIQRQIDAADTDEFIENTAREKLGLVKDGEIKYMPAQ